jgi:hypothetical protein
VTLVSRERSFGERGGGNCAAPHSPVGKAATARNVDPDGSLPKGLSANNFWSIVSEARLTRPLRAGGPTRRGDPVVA